MTRESISDKPNTHKQTNIKSQFLPWANTMLLFTLWQPHQLSPWCFKSMKSFFFFCLWPLCCSYIVVVIKAQLILVGNKINGWVNAMRARGDIYSAWNICTRGVISKRGYRRRRVGLWASRTVRVGIAGAWNLASEYDEASNANDALLYISILHRERVIYPCLCLWDINWAKYFERFRGKIFWWKYDTIKLLLYYI